MDDGEGSGPRGRGSPIIIANGAWIPREVLAEFRAAVVVIAPDVAEAVGAVLEREAAD